MTLTLNCLSEHGSEPTRLIKVLSTSIGIDTDYTCSHRTVCEINRNTATLLERLKYDCEGKPICGVKKYISHVNEQECPRHRNFINDKLTNYQLIRYECFKTKEKGKICQKSAGTTLQLGINLYHVLVRW